MKILFTGATGVIGRASLPHLTSAGHDVAAVCRSPDDRQWLDDAGARPVEVDLFDREAVGHAVSGKDAVAHFATSIPRLNDMKSRANWEMNDRLRSIATAHLVDAALQHGATRFVQESVSFVYGDGGDDWLGESSRIDPAWDVLDSALTAEDHIQRFRTGGGTGVVLRMARLYGPGRTSEELIEGVANRKIPVVGKGDNFVSSLHVDDAATAVLGALSAPGGTYNVTDDQPMRSAENLFALSNALGAPEPRRIPSLLARVVLGKAAALLTISHRVSNRAFRDATGWAPTYPSATEGWAASVEQNRAQAAR